MNVINSYNSINVLTEDNYSLSTNLYESKHASKKVLIINSATAVSKKLYHKYALFMSSQGYHVITYDYRGIADSRPKKLVGFKADFNDWAKKDFEGILFFIEAFYPKHKIFVLGHSIGGVLIGMTEKCRNLDGIITIAAQTAYYKDWHAKWKYYFIWHILLPLVTYIVRYFPGKKLKLSEDIPKRIIQQWHRRRLYTDFTEQLECEGILSYFEMYRGKLLALGFTDDSIGTKNAIDRLQKLYTNAKKETKMIQPTKHDIGHFGFFKNENEQIWLKTLVWFNSASQI